MSREPDYCAPCLARWDRLSRDERKRTPVPRAVTTVRGTRVCTKCDTEAMRTILEQADIEAHS